MTEIPKDEPHVPVSPELKSELLSTLRRHSTQGLFIAPNIPPKKLENARRSCVTPLDEEIYGLVDSTVFGSAENCLLVGSSGVFFRNAWASASPGRYFLSYSELQNATLAKYDYHTVSIGGLKFDTAGSSMSDEKRIINLIQDIQLCTRTDSALKKLEPQAPKKTVGEALIELKHLKDEGILSDDEYEQKRTTLIKKL